MKSALRSLIVTTLIVLMCAGIAWLYLKSKAASRPLHRPIPTKFFADSTKPIIVLKLESPTVAAIKDLPVDVVVWADVQVTADNKVVVLSERELGNPNFQSESTDSPATNMYSHLPAKYLTYESVLKSKPKVPLLEELLKSQNSRRFVINVFEYAPEADVVFSELITNLKADDRIIFHSEQDGPLSDLRKLRPMWLYGTSRAQVVQTLFLSTIGLEGNAPLKGDVLITRYRANETNQGAALFTEKLLAEAKRRSMKVLVGPVSKSEADELIQLGVDGIITNQP